MPAYVTLPGTSGNYFDTPHTNLLPNADTANLQQGLGYWSVSSANVGSHAVSQALTPVFGTFHAQGAVTGTPAVAEARSAGGGSFTSITPTVTGSDPYSAVVSVAANTAGRDGRVSLEYFNAGASQIDEVNGTWTPLSTSQFTTLTVTDAAAPALAVYVRMIIELRPTGGVGNLVNNEKLYWDAACIRNDTTATFVPSVKIIGDLDMRAKVAPTDATPTSAETLIGQRSGNNGYAMTIGTGGELVVYYGTGSGTRQETSSGASLTDATTVVLRSYFDLSAGTWYHLKDGVQFDSSASFSTTAGSPYTGPLAVGSDSAGSSGNFDGDIYYIEVRDGIDGPVVARFDADDWVGV